MRIDAYYNLHKKCLSIRSRETENYGKVIGHQSSVLVEDAKFIIHPAGLRKTRETGVKTVHAFVRGKMSRELWNIDLSRAWESIYYDPFITDGFINYEGELVESADFVLICDKVMTAQNIKLQNSD